MIAVSLFDGMGGLAIACKVAGVNLERYYASENNKHAIAQTKANFGKKAIHMGDVRQLDVRHIVDSIDVLAGGSPCQSFSFAGKRNGMTTKCEIEITTLAQYLQLKKENFEFEGQSYLFWEYVRVLEDIRRYNNPDVLFLLENVEMTQKWEDVINTALGVKGQHLDSALVSAQVRKRIYWSNIRCRPVGLFDEVLTDFPVPEDRGLLIKDILDEHVDPKYYLSPERVEKLINWGVRNRESGNGFSPNFKTVLDKAVTLTTSSNHGQSTLIVTTGRLVNRPLDENGVRKDGKGLKKTECLELNESFKSHCLTTVSKDSLIVQLNPSKESHGQQPYQQNRIYDAKGMSPALCANKADILIYQSGRGKNKGGSHIEKSPTLTANAWQENNFIMGEDENSYIRRITPSEAAKLQTVPKWYKWECSETQQYQMLGNGWTIEMIAHFLSYLPFK